MKKSFRINNEVAEMITSGINIFLELPVQEMTKIACEAEDLGFEKCWVYDEGLITRDPYLTLAAIAASTTTMQLGTGITNPYTRHPGVTAASIATLDEFSGGRAFLGIGAGGSITLAPLGLQMTKPLATVREMIETSRRLFAGETLTYEGKSVVFNSASISYGRPGIEIWFAGRGPKMLALGGELADGVALDFVYKDSLKYWVDLIRQGGERSGNKPKITYSAPIVTTQKSLEDVRPHMTYRLVDSPPEVRAKIGMSDDDVAAVRQAMSGGLVEAGKLIKDEWLDPFVIKGTPAECADELKKLMEIHQMDEYLLPILNTEEASRVMQETVEVLRVS
jgi:5,10-methylenetetrahydromethanopterin reductase